MIDRTSMLRCAVLCSCAVSQFVWEPEGWGTEARILFLLTEAIANDVCHIWQRARWQRRRWQRRRRRSCIDPLLLLSSQPAWCGLVAAAATAGSCCRSVKPTPAAHSNMIAYNYYSSQHRSHRRSSQQHGGGWNSSVARCLVALLHVLSLYEAGEACPFSEL